MDFQFFLGNVREYKKNIYNVILLVDAELKEQRVTKHMLQKLRASMSRYSKQIKKELIKNQFKFQVYKLLKIINKNDF